MDRRKVVGLYVLIQYVIERLDDSQEIFPETIVLVQREVVAKTSGHLKKVMEDRDFAKLSSILNPDPQGIFSCTKSGKKLVWKMGNSLSLPSGLFIIISALIKPPLHPPQFRRVS